jgi:hypothetical protein
VKPISIERFGGRRHFFLAFRADAADESLRLNQVDGSGDEERLDAHVHEARNGGGRVVGVQGGEDEVACERGLDGDLGRLEVADFADEDDVRVLPRKERSAAAKFKPICSFICT